MKYRLSLYSSFSRLNTSYANVHNLLVFYVQPLRTWTRSIITNMRNEGKLSYPIRTNTCPPHHNHNNNIRRKVPPTSIQLRTTFKLGRLLSLSRSWTSLITNAQTPQRFLLVTRESGRQSKRSE